MSEYPRGYRVEKFASEIERKMRTGNSTSTSFLTFAELHHIKAPRMHRTIRCPICAMPLFVGKHPRVFNCPNCRHSSFPCDRCDDTDCSKDECKFDDGEYREEATGIWYWKGEKVFG